MSSMDLPTAKQTYTLNGVTFEVDAHYVVQKKLGAGGFGMVASAMDARTGDMVAVKRVKEAFKDVINCKRALREIRMMKAFQTHENIVSLRDIMLPERSDGGWTDLYLVMDLMDTDLHFIIHSKQSLSCGHIVWFTYQMMRGLKAIHSANIVHRDIKPGNLLVNANGDLRIADLGLARTVDDALPKQHLTEYVVTRWYRAPELVAQNSQYDNAVDMWSAGLVVAECLGRSCLLPGKDYLHQMRLIVQLVGTPSEADLAVLQDPMAAEYVRRLPHANPARFASLYPHAETQAIELLEQLLVFDPSQRLTAARALCTPYLAELNAMNDAPDVPPIPTSSWDVESEGIEESDLKALVWAELKYFHPEVGPAPSTFASSPARVTDLTM